MPASVYSVNRSLLPIKKEIKSKTKYKFDVIGLLEPTSSVLFNNHLYSALAFLKIVFLDFLSKCLFKYRFANGFDIIQYIVLHFINLYCFLPNIQLWSLSAIAVEVPT
jgi:hypothetical protein